MTREQIISKIQSMLRLQENTNFEAEAENAARMIDKLCKQYGITVEDASSPIVNDEEFSVYKRKDSAYVTLLNAVANYYGAKLYLKNNYNTGVKSYQIIGTEAQQIQTKLYFEFLYESMLKECEIAYNAEKIITELQGKSMQKSFRINFKKAFSQQVYARLLKMGAKDNTPDADAVKKKVSLMRFGKSTKLSGARGDGANAGYDSGSNVSLNRQTSGAKQMALGSA